MQARLSRRDVLRTLTAAGAMLGAAPALSGCTAAMKSETGLPVTIAEAGKRLRAGTLTSEALTRAYIQCIRELQPKLNAFITVPEDQALAAAAALDAELKAGKDRGPLHGIPIVYKDNCDTAGILTTMGSQFFSKRVATADATVVRLLKTAGTVTLGKTNMNELAAGVAGANKYYGNAHNPWDVTRWPGGSSSGSGAAVAANLCLGGIGTDTGISVRGPAGWCGIVGIRPTYGRVSVAGAYPRAYSFDTIGPLARTVADAATLLNAMVGYDPSDKYSVQSPKEDFTAGLPRDIRGVRLGIVENFTYRNVDPEVADAVRGAVEKLASLGAQVKQVRIPLFEDKINYSYPLTILLYEFNQILADEYRTADRNLFGPVVQANMARGSQIPKATYEKAIAERPKEIAEIRAVFKDVDAFLAPTHPIVAPLQTVDAEGSERVRQFTVPVSFTGLPAVSVPCGFSPSGLPIGLHIVGNEMQEALLLRIAARLEAATDFHRRKPPLYCS
jgi:aspartyl-tRNA(Asn)/glutamyl-tRNA(Gln) amidotransferase subunit A